MHTPIVVFVGLLLPIVVGSYAEITKDTLPTFQQVTAQARLD